MNANSETGEWGGGDQPPSAPDPDGDRAANETRVNELMELDAKEAVAILAADGGAAKLDLEVPDFPGPIAEACYWDDSTIVGIQGPVGSGKTTTVLKSRLRRAMVMPRSVIDGRRYYKLLVIRENYRPLAPDLWVPGAPTFSRSFRPSSVTGSAAVGAPQPSPCSSTTGRAKSSSSPSSWRLATMWRPRFGATRRPTSGYTRWTPIRSRC